MDTLPVETLTETKAKAAEREKTDAPGIGHNSTGVSAERLTAYLQRIGRLEEEKSGLADDIKDIYAEAKAFGYDVKTLRQIVKLRKMDDQKRREADEMLQLYMSTLGMS